MVFRDVVARETLAPPWRELLRALRRLEARGEIRGGRFVAGYVGEQFALPEAIEALRAARRSGDDADVIDVSDYDPLRIAGALTGGVVASRACNASRLRRHEARASDGSGKPAL